MRIQVNGDDLDLPAPCSVAALLDRLALADRPCAVELNREVVPRRQHADRQLHDGDAVEIVTLVGGG